MSLLNPEQQKAAETLEGPLLVIAGAGSGKTRVLTYRIVNLLKQKKAVADQILAVTFTNKAAREMKERVEKMLGRHTDSLWLNTFHSACVKILRKEIEVLGYSPQFVIYDDQDQLTAIKQCFKILNWDSSRMNPRTIQAQINGAKNQGLAPHHFLKKEVSHYEGKIATLFELYQQELKKADALDFGDLLALTVHLFQKHPAILEKYRTRFQYCLVDEYQDTNHVQYLLIKLLCEKHQNICVVGDEDQSIYSWRGADISNILSFTKDFPTAKLIKLEQNYRSTKNIIEATSGLIAHNRNRNPKKLFTENETGEFIQVVHLEDEYHEARFVVGEIIRHRQEQENALRDFSIFYRTHAQSRIFEDILRQNDIPYQIYGGMHFYGRAEIKDMMGYFRLISNPKDSMSFLRIVNTPARGIGNVTIEKISEIAQRENSSLYEAAKNFSKKQDVAIGTRKKLETFIDLIEMLIRAKNEMDLSGLYHEILNKTGYLKYLKEEKSIEAESRIENLNELDSALSEFLRRNPTGTLEIYLEEISLIADLDSLDESDDFVKLMTFHSAKGLEFLIVFMVGMEEGLFPHRQSEWDPSEMEEERRLCYVGMTRAQKNLCLTHTNVRRVRGIPQLNLPSRFLHEIPKEYLHEMDLRRKVKSAIHRKASSLFEEDCDTNEIFDENFNQDPPENSYRTGMRVRHPSFGTGVICRVEGEEESTKITIKFDQGYIKKFMAIQTPLDRV